MAEYCNYMFDNKNNKLLLIVKHKYNVHRSSILKLEDTILTDFNTISLSKTIHISMGQSTNSALTFLSYPYYVHSISFNVDWWLSILLSFSYHVLRYLIHRIPSYNGLFLLSSVIYYCNCHHLDRYHFYILVDCCVVLNCCRFMP